MLRNAMPAAQPSLSMKSGVIGNCPTRPRMPSVPKYFLVIDAPSFLFSRFDSRNHAHHVDGFSNIMYPQDACTLEHGHGCQRQAAKEALIDRTPKRLTNHALA